MPTSVTCFCGKTFQAPDTLAGNYTHCPACGSVVYVPWPLRATQDRLRGPSPIRTLGKILGALMLAALVIALLLPAWSSGTSQPARRAQCLNNLKQIALALHNYHDVYKVFPPQAVTRPDGKPLLSWRVLLLPYLEEDDLYSRFKLDEPWDSRNNLPLLALMPTVYHCPSDPAPPGMTSYEGVVGPHTMWRNDGNCVSLAGVTDGTSNTIFFGEASGPVPWSAPQDIRHDVNLPQAGFGSPHPDGFNAAHVDGSVRFIRRTMAPMYLESLLTRDGGEVICDESL
jgi:prepilin-type processing-associated H-X9-DG protein